MEYEVVDCRTKEKLEQLLNEIESYNSEEIQEIWDAKHFDRVYYGDFGDCHPYPMKVGEIIIIEPYDEYEDECDWYIVGTGEEWCEEFLNSRINELNQQISEINKLKGEIRG